MAKKILIIEDDAALRQLLVQLLTDEGYVVLEAANGLRLVSYLRVHRPDLVLLDVCMSWLDGVELCRSLRRNPEFGRTPVCFLSARATPTDIQRGLDAGADSYLTKPVALETLLDSIARLTSASAAEGAPAH